MTLNDLPTDDNLDWNIEIEPGVAMPRVGFGVFQIPLEQTQRAVSQALELGYRHIDVATIYGNEKEVGDAIKASGLPREEVFVTTKLWNDDQGAERVAPALKRSLDLLQLETVDLYLIHWPTPARGLYEETWEAMLAAQQAGLARSVGVSNFTPAHIDRIHTSSGVLPSVNQIELHPLLTQDTAIEHHKHQGITTTAWSPLAKSEALALGVVRSIAIKLAKTPAQIVLRWHLQRGTAVIPKSVTPDRMAQNLALFDFTLSAADMAKLTHEDRGYRTGPNPDEFNR